MITGWQEPTGGGAERGGASYLDCESRRSQRENAEVDALGFCGDKEELCILGSWDLGIGFGGLEDEDLVYEICVDLLCKLYF